MSMDTSTTSTKSQPTRARTSTPQVVVVDLGERQPPEEVRRLCKGEGKLLDHVERIITDLTAAGTVTAGAQPVVIVVRELSSDDIDEDDDD